MRRAQIRLAAIVTTGVLFAGSWIAVARWGDRSASVAGASQATAPVTPADGIGSGTTDSVAPVQAPIPSTQS